MAMYRNQRLFSDYYLQELVPETSFWEEVKEDELQKAFDEIKSIYQQQKTRLEDLNESQLEERFIRPILRRLGHIYEVNVSLPRTYEGLKHPDYVFYNSEETKKAGVSKAIAIGEAKRYGRPLDRKLKTESEPFEVQNPSLQMSRYLWISEVPWGILTDGRLWRVYERETSKRLDIFYEIDLFKLLGEGTLDDFKYFYLFFRKEAFPSFLQKVYNESLEYAKAVGGELKENIYKALKVLAEGFLKTPANNLSAENLKEIHDNCHIFLYRLLFIFYAEARGLLPLDSRIYKDTYSLNSLKNEVKEKIDKKEPISPILSVYWDRLKTLFDLINKGSQSFGISKEDMYVPPYNGGLFDPTKHPFLEKYKVADKWLIEAVDLLARLPSRKNSQVKAFVDYSSLEIRHLGSIYEGLLEYKLKVAETDMVAIKEKGKETWKSKDEIKVEKIVEEAPKGTLYCVTDKGERKATGSYYTPGYIVEYIVENTLGPIIEEKRRLAEKIAGERKKDIEDIKKEIRSLKTQVSRATTPLMKSVSEKKLTRKEAKLKELEIETVPSSILIDEILKTKVLDPAMGSGHFLVEATDYLARTLVETLSGEITPKQEPFVVKEKPAIYEVKTKEIEEDDLRWARREVVEKCIYGVDLNPLAVELAKLSLWLSTVAKDKPLSFLDHHLRCGNSLIGAKVKGLGRLPEISKKERIKKDKGQLGLFEQSLKRRLPVVLGDVIQMLKKPSDKVEQIREKENIYNKILDILTPFKETASVWMSVYFGNGRIDYDWMLGLIENSGRWDEVKEKGWFKRAEGIDKEKRFFHWELEFPEIFFDDKGSEKDNPGFDAVVGNPPWVESKFLESSSKIYHESCFSTMEGQYDLFNGFIETGRSLLCMNGLFGMILPNRFCANPDYLQLRKFLLTKYPSIFIRDYGDGVFPEVNMPSCILIAASRGALRNMYIESQSGIGFSLGYDDILSNPAIIFRIDSSPALEKILKKCHDNSSSLGTFYENARGVEIGKSSQLVSRVRTANSVPFGVGEDLSRYMFAPSCYLKLGDSNTDYKDPSLYEGSKILVRKTGHGINASVDINANYVIQVIYIFKEKSTSELDDYYVLGLINSRLMHEIYYSLFGEREKRTFPHIRQEQFLQLPIRHISFTTPQDKRKQVFEEGKTLYENYLKTNSWYSVFFFIQQRLSAKPEESDVIHDLLAFLAEKMIEYNKAKNEEIKSFLKWLEREIGTEIESVSNKTAIKDYYEGTIDELLNILKKNKKKLKIDPHRREFQDKVTEEFTKSTFKLIPLKQTIDATDNLIDRIVYKLYGLIEEEIKTIEKT